MNTRATLMAEHTAQANRPTPREFPAFAAAFATASTKPPSRPAPPGPDPQAAVSGSMEAEMRLLAMRVAILARRVEELAAENESLRADMGALLRRRPSAPYSSVAPTSEVVRIPDSMRPDSKLPAPKSQTGR